MATVHLYQTEVDLLQSKLKKVARMTKIISGIPLIGNLLIPDSDLEDFLLELLDKPVPIAIIDSGTAHIVYHRLVKPAKLGFEGQKVIPNVSDSPYNIVINLMHKLEKAFPEIVDID